MGIHDISNHLPAEEDVRLLSLAINETDRGILILDHDRRAVYLNRAFTELFGYAPSEVYGKRPVEFLVGVNTDPRSVQHMQQRWNGRQRFEEDLLLYDKAGHEIWVSVSANPIHDNEGNIRNLGIIFANITEAKHIQTLQRTVLEALASGMSLAELADMLCRQVEAIAPEVISSMVLIDSDQHVHPLAGPNLPEKYSAALEGLPIGPNAGSCGTAAYTGEPVCATDIETDPRWEPYKAMVLPLGLRACWSSPIKMRDGRVAGTFAFYYREKQEPKPLHKKLVSVCLHLCILAIERDEARQKIAQLSYSDPLTGLPNRASLYDVASGMLSRSKGEEVSFFALDLDNFKDVNNTLGHAAGDRVLVETAYRLQKLCSQLGIVSRTASDDFAIVIPSCNASRASTLAERMLDVLRAPIDIYGFPLSLSASIGISVTQDNNMAPHVFAEQAIAASHKVKSAGRARYGFYSPEMNRQAQERFVMGTALRNALAEASLRLDYQPQLRLSTSELAGVEALTRWNGSKLGDIPPDRFIPLAEEIGLVEEIGNWSLREACRQMSLWRGQGVPIPTVSVNLSPQHFRSRELPGFVRSLLLEYDLPASCLTLEITEGVMMDLNPESLAIVVALHDIGISLSMDDFGKGFSSLARLTQLPISELKLDRTFVMGLEDDPGLQAVITAVIRIGQSLGMRVVAEGVEAEAQAGILASLGCDIAQGYLYGKAMPVPDLERWIASRNSVSPQSPANVNTVTS